MHNYANSDEFIQRVRFDMKTIYVTVRLEIPENMDGHKVAFEMDYEFSYNDQVLESEIVGIDHEP